MRRSGLHWRKCPHSVLLTMVVVKRAQSVLHARPAYRPKRRLPLLISHRPLLPYPVRGSESHRHSRQNPIDPALMTSLDKSGRMIWLGIPQRTHWTQCQAEDQTPRQSQLHMYLHTKVSNVGTWSALFETDQQLLNIWWYPYDMSFTVRNFTLFLTMLRSCCLSYLTSSLRQRLSFISNSRLFT